MVMTLLQMLHAASNGGCRLVIGRRLSGGDMYVVLDLGRTDRKQPITSSSSSSAEPHIQSSATSTVRGLSSSSSAPEAARQQQEQRQNPLADMDYASVQLRDGIDTVILGSLGLWCAAFHTVILRSCPCSMSWCISCEMYCMSKLAAHSCNGRAHLCRHVCAAVGCLF